MNRRDAMVALAAAPFASFAQQSDKISRIGYLGARSRSTPSNPDPYYDAFLEGLREIGLVEGKNLIIEWRFADGNYERLPKLAAELVALNVELIATHSTPPSLAMQRATSTIPIVFMSVIDPVANGLVASLARPGRNVTGVANIQEDTSSKLLEILQAAIPALSRVAVFLNPGNASAAKLLKGHQDAARQMSITLWPISAGTAMEIENGFESAKRERAHAVVIAGDPFFVTVRRQIAALSLKHQLPSISSLREDALAGGLMSYGSLNAAQYQRAATFVDRILKGAKPADLPVEQPTRFEFVINLKTAKALGLTIPQSVLIRADEVIQ